MTPRSARISSPPHEFEGQCTCFPDRVLGPKGWANLNPACRRHDWHYSLLREHKDLWDRREWDRFKEWADATLWVAVTIELRRVWGHWVGGFVAKSMFAAVRSKLGEKAAGGSW